MSENSTILLVESSKFFLTIQKQFLNRLPVNIVEAANAADARAICRTNKPGLIYMAADLPDQSGLECCRQFKSDPQLQSIPIILICNEQTADPTAITRQAGCDALLVKPLDRRRFLEIGRSFLAGFREARRTCLIPVQVRSNGEKLFARALDISSGGVFLKSDARFPIGTSIELEIQLSRDGEPGPKISCQGRIPWLNTRENPTKPYHPVGFGVQFLDLPSNSQNVLNGFLRTLDKAS